MTVLKSTCRAFGIMRWPYRKMRKLNTMIKQLERSARNAAEENILHHRMKRLEACRRARDLLVLEAEANARARIAKPASQQSAKAEIASTGARYDSSGRLGNFKDPGYAFDTDHKGYALHEAMRKMMETEGLDTIGRSGHLDVESDPLSELASQVTAVQERFVRRPNRNKRQLPTRCPEEMALHEFVMGNPGLEAMASLTARLRRQKESKKQTSEHADDADGEVDIDGDDGKQIAWIVSSQNPAYTVNVRPSNPTARIPDVLVEERSRREATSPLEPSLALFPLNVSAIHGAA